MTSLSVPNPLASHRDTVRQLASFGVIGVVSTVAYVVLYAWLRMATPAGVANALALVITAVGNTAANRWLTFGVRGRDSMARHQAAGLLALPAQANLLAVLDAARDLDLERAAVRQRQSARRAVHGVEKGRRQGVMLVPTATWAIIGCLSPLAEH